MANVTYLSPGGDESAGLLLFPTISGTVGYDSGIHHTGPGSIKFDTTGSAVSCYVYTSANSLRAAGNRWSMWVYVPTNPGTNGASLFQAWQGTSNVYRLHMNSAGKLVLMRSGGLTLQTSASSLGTAGWHRISGAHTITSTTVNEIRIWVDGDPTPWLTVTNVTLGFATPDKAVLGVSNSPCDASFVVYIDDVYIDDGTTLDDPGDIRVTAKLPASRDAGSGWDNNSVTMSDATRTTAVSQRPTLEATVDVDYISHYATAQATEAFTLETAAAGDVDISGDSIVGYMGWARIWLSTTTGTPTWSLVLNGSTYALPDTGTTHTTPTQPVTSTTYPSNAQGIGLTSSAIAANTFLAECGVVVAYTIGGGATEYPQSVSATLTLSSTTLKSVGKVVNAPLTLSSTYLRSIGKGVSAPLTLSAGATKQVGRSIPATLTLSSTTTKQVGRKVVGTLALSATTLAQRVKLMTVTATLALSAAVKRQVGKGVSAPLTLTSATIKQIGKKVSAGLGLSALVDAVKQAGVQVYDQSVSASLALSAAVQKQISRKVSATLTLTAAVQALKVKIQSVVATLALSATVKRQVGKVVSAPLTLSVTYRRAIAYRVTAPLALGASVVKQVTSKVAATLSLSATTTKAVTKAVSASLSLGAVVNAVARHLSDIIKGAIALFHTPTATVDLTDSAASSVVVADSGGKVVIEDE